MGDTARLTYQLSFEDAWEYLQEVEIATGATLAIKLHQPRRLKGGELYRARVAITATRREGAKDIERTAFCEIGGARGARTVPAALVRAATELSARLEATTADRVKQAAF